MQTQAAIAQAPDVPFAIETIELDEPREQEVLVRLVATGICHTDLALKASGRFTPGVLGHEGAGVIERVGSAVRGLAPGDHVVLSYFACHHCSECVSGHTAYCENGFVPNYGGGRADGSHPVSWNGQPIPSNFFNQSSFARHAIAHQNNAVKVPADLPLEMLGPLGCGFQTGAGAVLNAFKLQPGQSLAVFGAGAVGLAAVMAAKAAGAQVIVAVDLNADRLALSRELGATHAIKGDEQDAVAAIKQAAPGGVDFSLECIGSPAVLRQAFDSLKPLGSCGLLGVSAPGKEVAIEMNSLLQGRRLLGLIEGDSDPQRFVPQMIELYRAGRFPFDRLVAFYPFENINQAIADMASGKTIKPVLRMT